MERADRQEPAEARAGELGGSPARARYAYELRSPLTYARAIAFAHVPLQLWWSPRDRIVVQQKRQSARLFKTVTKLNPKADIVGYTGSWNHSAEMRAKTHLPLALAAFGLLPEPYDKARGVRVLRGSPSSRASCRRSAPARTPSPCWAPRRSVEPGPHPTAPHPTAENRARTKNHRAGGAFIRRLR